MALLMIFISLFIAIQIAAVATDCNVPAPPEACPQLPNIPNGKVRLINRTSLGFVEARIECLAGFHLAGGPSTIICKNHAFRWTSDPGICIQRTNLNFEKISDAIKEDNAELLKELLLNGVAINAQNGTGFTSLHMAAVNGSLNVARFLLNSSDIDMRALTTSWQEPIHLAAMYDQVEIVDLLLEKASSGNETSSAAIMEAREAFTGRTPMFYAGAKVAKLLLKRSANTTHCDHQMMQPIHAAVTDKRTDVVKLMLEKDGALKDSSCCGSMKRTISHLAAENNFADFLTGLVDVFNETVLDGNSNTPLCYIGQNDSLNFAKRLPSSIDLTKVNCTYGEDGRIGSVMHLAGYYKRSKVIEWMLENGADVMIRDSKGATILHAIAAVPVKNSDHDLTPITALINTLTSFNVEIVDAVDSKLRTAFVTSVIVNSQPIADILLNEFAAFPSIVDDQGRSPFHYVKTQRFLAFLFASVPNAVGEVNRRSNNCTNVTDELCLRLGSMTPLHVAIKDKKPLEMIRYMLKFKANPNDVNDFGQSALHLAVEADYRDAVTFLLKKHADPKLRDHDGKTALMMAVKKRDLSLVRTLLASSGESVSILDNSGESAAHMAVRINFTEALKLFASSKHTNMSMRDSRGRTPLHYALEIENEQAALILANINFGNSINEQDLVTLETPLHTVVRRNLKNLAQVLLENGAKTSLLNADGNDPIHEALIAQNFDMVKLIYSNRVINPLASVTSLKRNQLHLVLRSGELATDIAKWLIAKIDGPVLKALLTMLDSFDETPLHRAVTHENVLLTKLFLQHNPNACQVKDGHGLTSVQLAKHLGYKYLHAEMLKIPQCNLAEKCSAGTVNPSAVKCGKLPSVTNGAVVEITDMICSDHATDVVRKATFICATGYVLAGSNILSCRNEGRWQIEGYCKAPCVTDPSVPNGSYTPQTISCHDDYFMNGTCDLPVCDRSGSWSLGGNCLKKDLLKDPTCNSFWELTDATCMSLKRGFIQENTPYQHYRTGSQDSCYVIKGPRNKKIRMNFEIWSNMDSDEVRLFDGYKSADPLISYFHASSHPAALYLAKSGFAFIRYQRFSSSYGQFKLQWEIID